MIFFMWMECRKRLEMVEYALEKFEAMLKRQMWGIDGETQGFRE